MTPESILSPGTGISSLKSPNGRFELVMQVDGNLVISIVRGATFWNSGTMGNPGAFAQLQEDGNLVIYSARKDALWNTQTNQNPGASLFLGDDGCLSIRKIDGTVLWTSGISIGTPIWSSEFGEIHSPNQKYRAIMQGDGNFVIYTKHGKAVWSTGTDSSGANRAVIQSDGNFVLYGTSGAIWDSHTSGYTNAILSLRDDGQLVIWDCGSGHAQLIWASSVAPGVPILPGEELNDMYSAARIARFVRQGDGNMVIYGIKGNAIWATRTDGHHDSRAIMQSDGNFVVYDSNNVALWSSQTDGNPESFVGLREIGQIVVFS